MRPTRWLLLASLVACHEPDPESVVVVIDDAGLQRQDVVLSDDSRVPGLDLPGPVGDDGSAADAEDDVELGWRRLAMGAAGDLHRVRFDAATGLRAVGSGGTILSPHAGGWIREYAPVGHEVRDVVAAAGTLQAVGDGGLWLDLGSDGVWRRFEAGVQEDLRGAAALESSALVVGSDGIVLRREGGSVHYEHTAVGMDLRAVAAAGDEAFAVGDGVVLRRVAEGATFNWFEDSGATFEGVLLGAFALDPSNVWAVGEGGQVLHFTGGWSPESQGELALRGVAGGAGWLVAVGDSGSFLSRSSEGAWEPVADVEGPLFAQSRYEGVAIGGGAIVAVGGGGAMQRKVLPDEPFIDEAAAPSSAIRALAAGPTGVAGVGDDGVLVWLDGDGHGALAVPEPVPLRGVTFEGDVLWAVGHSGAILRRTPASAAVLLPGWTSADLEAAIPHPDGGVLAVGRAGAAVHIAWAAGHAVPEDTGQSRDLLGLFQDGDRIVAVGEQGTLLIREEGAWAPLASGAGVDLHGGGAAGGHAVVVGAFGTVLRWSQWGAPESVPGDPLAVYHDALVSDDGSAILVGWAGRVDSLGADGTLSAHSSPTGAALYGIADWGGERVVAGGHSELWMYGEVGVGGRSGP